jgi:hypothetical protein
MFYRVFSLKGDVVQPAALQEHLRSLGVEAPFEVRGDEHGWTSCQFRLVEGSSPLQIERYLTDADEIRDDLDAWAAWLETQSGNPNHLRLMQHVIGSEQMFTLKRPDDHADEAQVNQVCKAIVQFLAGKTRGVYQIDNIGFFAASGTILLPEN